MATRSTDTAVGGAGSARYAYLVGRLRSRQITIEEATELFSVLQDALARSTGPAPPPPRESQSPGSVAPPKSRSFGLPQVNDDTVALALLAMGAGAGLLAAILKRSAEGPRPVASK